MKNIKGKIIPQAIDLEEAVLGAMMIDKKGVIEAIDIISSSEMFYKPEHKIIFNAIKEVYINGGAVDLLTVANTLKKDNKLENAGGDYYLVELTQKVASSAHIEFHCRIILQKYIQRELIKNASGIIESSYREDVDVFNLLDYAYNQLNEVSEASLKQQEVAFGDVLSSVLDRGIKIFNGDIKAGIDTPIKRLTSKTGGWRDTELIIMAARPGMGKTAFALKAGIDAAKKGTPTAFFSLEMSREQLVSRILSMEYKIDNSKFNVSGLNIQEQCIINDGKSELGKLPFYIDDTANLSIEQLQLKAKRLKSKFGIKLLIVDYLQLMSGKSNSRENEISKISRGLKMIAKELKIPVIALSQLSRAVETRGGNKRPQLSDLRESGAIEQDADMVMFFFRPEYYGMSEWDDYDRGCCIGEAEYIVAKNRNGGLVKNRMKFQGRYTLFSDLESGFEFQDENLQSEFIKDPF